MQIDWTAEPEDGRVLCAVLAFMWTDARSHSAGRHSPVLLRSVAFSAIPLTTCVMQGVMDTALSHVCAAHGEAVVMLLPQLQGFMEILDEEKWEALLLKLLHCCDRFLHKPTTLLPCLQLVQDIMMDRFSHRSSQRGRQSCALRTERCVLEGECHTAVKELLALLPKWMWKMASKTSDGLHV